MPFFRKKPVVIEAVQWDGDQRTFDMIERWVGKAVSDADGYTLLIPTLEGVMEASLNDWIIRGVQGEFYPCKPDIFDATYEAVDNPVRPYSMIAQGEHHGVRRLQRSE